MDIFNILILYFSEYSKLFFIFIERNNSHNKFFFLLLLLWMHGFWGDKLWVISFPRAVYCSFTTNRAYLFFPVRTPREWLWSCLGPFCSSAQTIHLTWQLIRSIIGLVKNEPHEKWSVATECLVHNRSFILQTWLLCLSRCGVMRKARWTLVFTPSENVCPGVGPFPW